MDTPLQFIDYAIIGSMLVGLVAVGVFFAKKGGETVDAFLVSGRTLPWYLAGGSMIATSFAADTPLWICNLVRTHGIHYVWQYWSPLIGSLLAAVYFGRKLRRLGFVTDLEFMETRYGGRAAKLLRVWWGSWFILLLCPMISAWVIKAMETISREALGLPPEYQLSVTIGLIAVALVMCVFPGLLGVVITDFIQFAIATIGTVVLSVMAVNAVGGLDALVAKLEVMEAWNGRDLNIHPDIGDAPGQMSIWNAIGYLGFLWVAIGLSGGYHGQRLLASRDAKHASYAQLMQAVVYYSLLAWPWILVALCSLVLLPDLEGANQSVAYPRMIMTVLPIGLRGLLVAALMASFLSTVSTLFNWGASYVVNDIYRRFINNDATEQRYVFVGRLATVALAVAGAYISIVAQNIQQLLTLFYVVSTVSFVPGILRWLWWRINAKAELVGLGVGWTLAILLLFLKVFDGPAAYVLNLPEGVEFSTDGDLVGARMLFMVICVGASVVSASFWFKPEEMSILKNFLLRARPLAFGWKPVISELDRPYKTEESLGRTLVSWAIGVVAVGCVLFGVGNLLIGTRWLGLVLLLIGVLTFVVTVLRVRYDCRYDTGESSFDGNP